MTIEACELTNFLSYYDHTRIEFGLTTIILGQNNTGKSKLFDAINWALFGQAYHTESEEWRITGQWKLKGLDLINRRALQEASDSTEVSAIVKLEVRGDGDERYVVSRRLSARVTDQGQWTPCEERVVAYFTSVTGETDVYEADTAEQIIAAVAPPNLRPYFLFQGESVSQLLKLSDKQAYSDAIREMARIDVLTHAVDATKVLKDRMNRKLRKTEAANDEARRRETELDNAIEERELRIEGIQRDLATMASEFTSLSQQEKEINEFLSQTEDYRKKLSEVQNQERHLDEMRKRYQDHYQNATSRVPAWLAIPSMRLLSEFHTVYLALKDAKIAPLPVQEFFLNSIIDNGVCEVCGRNLDNEAISHVRSLLRRIENSKAVNSISNLATTIDNDLAFLESEELQIKQWREKSFDLYEGLQRQLRVVEQARKDLYDIAPSSADPRDQQEQFNRRKRELKSISDKLVELRVRSDHGTRHLDTARSELQAKKAQRRELSAAQGHQKEAWAAEVSDRLLDITSKVKEEYRKRIARAIEDRANAYFREMTADNPAAVGRLSMDLGSGGVYMVDEDDVRIDNVNQATRVSLQLSFVAGLLSEAGDSLGETYPFIADAPVSSLGGDNKLAAIRSMTNAFEQAVIILKDDVRSTDEQAILNDPVRKFIKTGEVDKAYVLRMSDGDTDTQHTLIEELTE